MWSYNLSSKSGACNPILWKIFVFDGLQKGYGLGNGPTSSGSMRGFREQISSILNIWRPSYDHLIGQHTPRVLQHTPGFSNTRSWRNELAGSLQPLLRTPIHCVHYWEKPYRHIVYRHGDYKITPARDPNKNKWENVCKWMARDVFKQRGKLHSNAAFEQTRTNNY